MNVHFSSQSSEWETPDELFTLLDREFHFTLDVCAGRTNHKVDKWFGMQDDGEFIDALTRRWGGWTCWMNPPYGRQIGKWVAYAYNQALLGAVVVCLLPARTDTKWWHEYVTRGEIRFLRGRVKFKGGKASAPFPSAVVVFCQGWTPRVKHWDWQALVTGRR